MITIDVAVAEIIKNIVRINHGNVAATSVFREEMSASHIASNTIKDVLDTGGAFLFSESKERNENLSPIKLSEGLRTASDSFLLWMPTILVHTYLPCRVKSIKF